MAYCNQQDIVDRKGSERLAELTGDSTGQSINAARVTKAINEFGNRIDNAVRVNYPKLPFDETNAFLNGLNIEGAYLILERDKELGWSEDQRADWKLLEKDLEKIAQGMYDLRTETEEEVEAKGTFKSNPRLFNRNSLNGPEDHNHV
ncbi:phage protein Gp36 family protein [Thiohalophilus sp.]|uniref:phage protein Gp36 family protein n=1 Tax=Thiohalophilus sp. TaxID=3028392 RepID=UPI002ACDC8B5|nr:phage protein Gp36 family protein [Thiohalophilus sp.]MDZ7802373.1 phage protein Gp36 family protein [Thiohalophilus sp.]